MYNEGISKVGDVLDLAVEKGIVDKAGAFLKYNGETLAQGREAAKNLLKESSNLLKEIDHKVRVAAGLIEGDETSAESAKDSEATEMTEASDNEEE